MHGNGCDLRRLRHHQPGDHKRQQRGYGQRRQQILENAARSDAARLHQRQRADRPDGDELVRRNSNLERADVPSRDHDGAPGTGNESIDIKSNGDGASGDCSAETGDERGPTSQEASKPSEAFPQIDVLAARLRPPRCQLCVCKRARERQSSTERPDGQHCRLARKHRGHDARRGENADANDVGDHDRRSIQWTKAAVERRQVRRGHDAVT